MPVAWRARASRSSPSRLPVSSADDVIRPFALDAGAKGQGNRHLAEQHHRLERTPRRHQEDTERACSAFVHPRSQCSRAGWRAMSRCESECLNFVLVYWLGLHAPCTMHHARTTPAYTQHAGSFSGLPCMLPDAPTCRERRGCRRNMRAQPTDMVASDGNVQRKSNRPVLV